MLQFINSIINEDIEEHGRHQRPDTKWVVHEITNMNVYVNKTPETVIGAPPVEVPIIT